MEKLLKSQNFRERLTTGIALTIIIVLGLLTPNANFFRFIFAFFGMMALIELGPVIHEKLFSGIITDDRCFVMELAIIILGVLSVVFALERFEIVLILLVSVVNDTGAYFVGNLLHDKIFETRPFPKTSPKKSWEGIIGGYWCAMMVMIALRVVFKIDINLWFVTFAPLMAIFGDYLESFVKRALGLKDSNERILAEKTPVLSTFERAMSGHGGYADRIDSWTAVACFMLLVKFID